MVERNTKRAGRTKRAAVALLVALALLAGRLDPTGGPSDSGRPRAAAVRKESSNG